MKALTQSKTVENIGIQTNKLDLSLGQTQTEYNTMPKESQTDQGTFVSIDESMLSVKNYIRKSF